MQIEHILFPLGYSRINQSDGEGWPWPNSSEINKIRANDAKKASSAASASTSQAASKAAKDSKFSRLATKIEEVVYNDMTDSEFNAEEFLEISSEAHIEAKIKRHKAHRQLMAARKHAKGRSFGFFSN